MTDTVADEDSATGNHSFTNYVSDGTSGTETADCDYGCGETDTRVVDITAGITVAYDSGSVALLNVPTHLKVVVAAYQGGRLVYAVVPEVKETMIVSLPDGLEADTVKVFFLNDGYAPVGLSREFEL